MSRTISHIPERHTRAGGAPWHGLPPGSPVRRVDRRTLRYAAAQLARAAREGRRPVPEEVRHRLAIYEHSRAYRSSAAIGFETRGEERRARQEARLRLRRAVLLGEFEDVAVERGNHRHGVLWLA